MAYFDYDDNPWVSRALNNPLRINNPDGSESSVKSMSFEADGKHYVVPTIRKKGNQLVEMSPDEAFSEAMRLGDGIPFDTEEQAIAYSKGLSNRLGRKGNKTMAYFDNEDRWYEDDPAMAAYIEEEEDRRRRRSQKRQWEEDRTLKDYIAATPKGQRRFTNIPGGDEDTFLMEEAPIQAPLGMPNDMKARAQYGVDPYQVTQERAQEIQAQGGTPDPEKIFMEVQNELGRKNEEAQQQFGLQQAAFLKHGPPSPPKVPNLDSTITALINADQFDKADALLAQIYGIDTGKEPIKPPDLQALVDIETKDKGFKAAERAVKKEEGKRKDRARTERFMGGMRNPRGRRRSRSRYPYNSKFFMPQYDSDNEDEFYTYGYGEFGR